MPNQCGHVRVRGNQFDNYLYTYDFITGAILMYSTPSNRWDIDRMQYCREDGDGQPTNVKELLNNADGEKLYRDFISAWDKIFDGNFEDVNGMTSYLSRVARCDGTAAMCPACSRISIGVQSCQTCGAYFGGAGVEDGYAHLDGNTLMGNPIGVDVLMNNITKLLLLARDGKVGICEGGNGLAFWLPDIHFDNATGHRFKRILNCKKFFELTDMTRADWVECSTIIGNNSFDAYIAFIEEYGERLMANREQSVLIGDANCLNDLRKKYIAAQSFRNSEEMCRFFFTKRTDYLEELAVPLYNTMIHTHMVFQNITYAGSVDWGFNRLARAMTAHDVRYQLLGIINDMMDDTSVDDVMKYVRSEFNA